jgi:hypothetical protein
VFATHERRPLVSDELQPNQAQHHARKSFDHELKMILKRHGMVPLGE